MSYHGASSGLVITKTANCLFFWQHIYYTYLSSVRFEHCMCHESLLTSFIMLLAWHVEHSLVHWYQQCVTVHHVPNWWIGNNWQGVWFVFLTTWIFHPSYFCGILVLCVSESFLTSFIYIKYIYFWASKSNKVSLVNLQTFNVCIHSENLSLRYNEMVFICGICMMGWYICSELFIDG